MLASLSFGAALFVGACSADRSGVVASAGDLGHIHDLAFDSQGQLLVGSHTGLYRIESINRAVLFGTEQHDLMAMTRSDEGDLLASGHPDLRIESYRVEGRPPFLGLARSSDDGQTWASLELLGDADFHALVQHRDGLFAAETSGRIWFLNSDGEWSKRGTIEARDLAIDPEDSAQQLAVDWDGQLWASADGARTWQEVSEAPALIEVEWLDAGGIVGVDEVGQFWRSEQPQRPWVQDVTGPSAVETFLVESESAESVTWWITAVGGRISTSSDQGVNWTFVYDPPDSD